MKKTRNDGIIYQQRSGLHDCWNAFMCDGATYSANDIPHCKTTATAPPKELILWDEAKSIYKKQIAAKNYDFKHEAFVCFYMDDYKFDGATKGVWHNYKHAEKVLSHFAGIITPDFSTYQDFPEPIKLYNTYRMRAFGHWYGDKGFAVINNVRWGTEETYRYCFDSVDKHSIIAIGTCGGSPRKYIDRDRFNKGFEEMLKVLEPKVIIVYGSANYPCFENARKQGIQIVAFQSKTACSFAKEGDYE